LICRNREEALKSLETLDPQKVFTARQEREERPIVFLFPGQGTQQANMGGQIYRTEPTFREEVDRCCEMLKPHVKVDLRSVIYPAEGDIHAAERLLDQTRIAQPALFVIEYALAQLWLSRGIRPEAMIGHSIGEYVAACVAGVFSLEDALALVSIRGQMMQNLTGGAMIAASLSETDALALLNEELSLAAINTPAQSVISGPVEAIEKLENHLTRLKINFRRLRASHAFHSPIMDLLKGAFVEEAQRVTLRPPQIPFISNVTGTWITENEIGDATYWYRHLRQTVRFADGIQLLSKQNKRIYLEVGPGQTITRMLRRWPENMSGERVFSSLDNLNAEAGLTTTLGKLWLSGAKIDWQEFYANEDRGRTELPNYPFQRQRYWIGPGLGQAPVSTSDLNARVARLKRSRPQIHKAHMDDAKNPPLPDNRPSLQNVYAPPASELEQTIANVWQQILGVRPIGVHDNFFELGGDSLLAIQVISRLQDALNITIPVAGLYENVTIKSLVELMQGAESGREPTQSTQAGERELKALHKKQYQMRQRSRKEK
jgi:acyl transferase domain-containing protein